MVGDADLAGGINMYGSEPHSFTAEDVLVSMTFAGQATAVVDARSYCAAAEQLRRLAMALETRSVIEGAKAVLIGTHGLTRDEAFEELCKRSQCDSRTVHDVAAGIVQAAIGSCVPARDHAG